MAIRLLHDSKGKSTKQVNGKQKGNSVKRLAIYQATLATCCANGIGNATTAEIAKRAGVAAGTLFCYYPTKLDLLNAVYKEIIVQLSAFREQSLSEAPEYSREAQLRKVWQSSVLWYRQHPLETSFCNMTINPSGESSPYIHSQTLEQLAPCYNAIKTIFYSAVEQGIVKPLPPMLLLRIFIANTIAVASLYQNQSSLAAFLTETPQILNELENAAWDMIALKSRSSTMK